MTVSPVRTASNQFTFFAALSVILFVAFLLRFAAFDHPLAIHMGEGLRDMFVAGHALTYGEWPIGGYDNGLLLFDNSPFYYYLIIALLMLGKTLLGVEILYILLSCGAIFGIALFARNFFGTPVALVSATLAAVAPRFVEEVGTFIWPPYFVPFFVVAAFFCLGYGVTKNKPSLIVLGIVPMVAAVAVHLAALPMLAFYGALALWLLSQRPAPVRTILTLVLGGGALLGAFFLPSFLTGGGASHTEARPYAELYVPVDVALSRTVSQITYTFGVGPNSNFYLLCLAGFAVLTTWFFVSKKIARKEKLVLSLLFLALLLQTVAAVLIDPSGIPRHLASVLWMVPIIVAVISVAPFGRSKTVSLVAVGLMVLLSAHVLLDARTQKALHNIPVFERQNYETLEAAVSTMAQTATRIKTEEAFSDYSFFTIAVRGDADIPVASYLFWGPLEKKLGTQLLQGPDVIMRSRSVAPDNTYVFLVCVNYFEASAFQECFRNGATVNTDYVLVDTVFESNVLYVYLAKRTTSHD